MRVLSPLASADQKRLAKAMGAVGLRFNNLDLVLVTACVCK